MNHYVVEYTVGTQARTTECFAFDTFGAKMWVVLNIVCDKVTSVRNGNFK